METLTELIDRQTLAPIIYPFKVIVSPVKALKEIAQKPSAKGLVVVVGLLVVTTAISEYATSSKIILTIDGILTRLLYSNMFVNFILTSSIEEAVAFFINWLVYAGLLLVLLRLLRPKDEEKPHPRLPFFILIGYVFSVFIIRMILAAALISTLPDLILPISTWPPATTADYNVYLSKFNAIWAPTLASQATSILFWICYAWFVILGAVALHYSREAAWRHAIMASLAAFLTILLLSRLLPISILI
jgi:hypothetical protein